MPFDLVVRPSLRAQRPRQPRRENRPASAERDFGFGRPEAPAAWEYPRLKPRLHALESPFYLYTTTN